MKSLLIAAGLLLGFSAGAQDARISFGVNNFGRHILVQRDPRAQTEQLRDITSYLPVIGYHKTLSKGLGLGVELGYGRHKGSITETGWDAGNSLSREERAIRYSEYYLSPTLFETFRPQNRNYVFIAGLSLPLSFSPDFDREYRIQSSNDNFRSTTVVTDPRGKLLSMGLFVSGSVQRRIVSKLFISPQLGIGTVYSRLRMQGYQTYAVPMTGGTNSQRVIDVKLTEQDFRFEIRPSLSLQFYL